MANVEFSRDPAVSLCPHLRYARSDHRKFTLFEFTDLVVLVGASIITNMM